ncbi:MAG: type I-A CRISPR-associated protein Cas4/Csa1 [Sulfolobus sp.]
MGGEYNIYFLTLPNLFVFFTYSELILLSKNIKKMPRSIDESLRGWNWNEPPVYSPSMSQVSVSELGYCSTLRNIYLKQKGYKGEVSTQILMGSMVHTVYARAIESIKRIVYSQQDISGDRLKTLMTDEFYSVLREFESLGQYAKVLWDHITNIYSAELDKIRSKFSNITRDSLVSILVPFYVEFPVDGSLVGLSSSLRVDAFVPFIPLIAEMKSGKYKYYHELSLAGYALAVESQYEIPVDFGYLCYVNVSEKEVRSNCKLIHINDSLRSEFLEMRDKGIEIIDKGIDPGVAKDCEKECVFYKVCHPS